MRIIYLSILLILLCTLNLDSQTISISANIFWKQKNLYILNYNKIAVPHLKIIYLNNTADSIYFYNYLNHNSSYLEFNYEKPLVSYVEGYLPTDETELLLSALPDWTDKKFTIIISCEHNTSQRNVLSKGVYNKTPSNINNLLKSDEHRVINELTSLFEIQETCEKIDSIFQYKYFNNPIKTTISESQLQSYLEKQNEVQTTNNIQNNHLFEKNCIFIEPFGSYSIDFDLTPFYLLKGKYYIFIDEYSTPKLVSISPCLTNSHFDDKRAFCKKNKHVITYQLPKYYNGFKLVSEKINKTSIELVIP